MHPQLDFLLLKFYAIKRKTVNNLLQHPIVFPNKPF
jgi:hypothetical protein